MNSKMSGGMMFLLSIPCLGIVCCALLLVLPASLSQTSALRIVMSVGGILVGSILGKALFSRRIRVFIHEFKHSLLSGLVGNKAVSLKSKRNSGEFVYKYTEATAYMNVFIGLAPYIMPLFTTIFFFILWLLRGIDDPWTIALTTIGLGIDLEHNIEDIGEHQTDLSQVTGGFFMALCYVALFNLVVILTTTHITLGGKAGIAASVDSAKRWATAVVQVREKEVVQIREKEEGRK